MMEEEQAPEEEEETPADDGADMMEAEEAEPVVIETNGMPFAGIDLNGNGIDDFEEFEQDCSCLTSNGLAVHTGDDSPYIEYTDPDGTVH